MTYNLFPAGRMKEQRGVALAIDDCYDFPQDFLRIREEYLAVTTAAIYICTHGFDGVHDEGE
jgi:hypothetical protein